MKLDNKFIFNRPIIKFRNLLILIIIFFIFSNLFTKKVTAQSDFDRQRTVGTAFEGIMLTGERREEMDLGNRALRIGNYLEAIQCFTRVLILSEEVKKRRSLEFTEDFSSLVALEKRGLAWSKMDDKGLSQLRQSSPMRTRNDCDREALNDWARALDLDPKFFKIYEHRANFYYDKKQYERAWADVQKAQSLGGKINPLLVEKIKGAMGKEKEIDEDVEPIKLSKKPDSPRPALTMEKVDSRRPSYQSIKGTIYIVEVTIQPDEDSDSNYSIILKDNIMVKYKMPINDAKKYGLINTAIQNDIDHVYNYYKTTNKVSKANKIRGDNFYAGKLIDMTYIGDSLTREVVKASLIDK